jgi:hypothetical protein
MEQSQVLEVMEMQAEMIRSPAKYLHIQSTEQCLASSKLLTPHPLSTQRVCPSPAPKGTHSPGGEGVNILEDARHWICLLQYNPSKYGRYHLTIYSLHRKYSFSFGPYLKGLGH